MVKTTAVISLTRTLPTAPPGPAVLDSSSAATDAASLRAGNVMSMMTVATTLTNHWRSAVRNKLFISAFFFFFTTRGSYFTFTRNNILVWYTSWCPNVHHVFSIVGPAYRCDNHTDFDCKTNYRCVPLWSVCNGHDDCRDNSDEQGCGETATRTEDLFVSWQWSNL